jgi:hypothetical protein
MTSRFYALLLSALLWAFPSPVAAQTSDPGSGQAAGGQGTGGQGGETDGGSPLTRPFRGLFGLGDSGRTGLDLSGSVFGAYDENVGATLPGRLFDPRYQRSGWYGGATSRLSFNWRGENASVNGFGSAATNYYPDFDDPLVPSYTGGLGFARPLGRRNNIRLSQVVSFSPYFLNGFFPDVPTLDEMPVPPAGVDPGLTVGGNTVVRYSTRAAFSRQLSRQSSVTLGYGYIRSNYSDVDRVHEQQHGSIGFRRQLTRHATLRLGYAYRSAVNHVDLPVEINPPLPITPQNAIDPQNKMHDIDVGVDYSRALTLSMSRRTTVSFSTGSSFLAARDVSGGDFSGRQRARFYVTGHAQLLHEMGRTWSLAVVYSRTAGFNDVVFEPVTSDSATASLSGLVGRRNEISFMGSASKGNVGASRANNEYSSYVAKAEWRRALTRHLAAQVSYLYYNHDFGQSVGLPLGFPQALDRQGVNFGLTVWLPLR